MATRATSFFHDEVSRSFEEEWPELARRLERFLAAKGVETWLRADVVQETATRVYRKWSRLDQSRPLWNLVVTIALGVLVDERRRVSRVELFSDVPQPDVDDVETRALHRVHLVKTRAALKRLRADQRRVLLAEIGEAAALDGSRSRIKVLRLRARLALKNELGPWAPSAITIRLRYLRTRVAQKRSALEVHTPAMANSLVNVAMAATLGLAGAAGAGVDGANPGLQQSLPQDPQVLSLNEIRRASLNRLAANIPRPEPSKLESKAKDRTKRKAGGLSGFVNGTREGAENLSEGAKKFGDGAKKFGDGAKNEADDQKEWAEDQLP